MTPTDTMTPARPTPDNPTDPCVCGHSRRNHGTDGDWDRAVCFICTHPHGGCRGFITSRELIDPTAAERDAFMAGYLLGCHGHGDDVIVADADKRDAADAWTVWVEGPGEDA